MVPSGRKELVKNQPCLSAKVFLSHRFDRLFVFASSAIASSMVRVYAL
jgi:hypothetical protein